MGRPFFSGQSFNMRYNFGKREITVFQNAMLILARVIQSESCYSISWPTLVFRILNLRIRYCRRSKLERNVLLYIDKWWIWIRTEMKHLGISKCSLTWWGGTPFTLNSCTGKELQIHVLNHPLACPCLNLDLFRWKRQPCLKLRTSATPDDFEIQ